MTYDPAGRPGHKCYIQVVAWDRFQHYKDRSPPWIKFYNSLLEDPGMAALPDASKAHLFGIWLLASRLGNKIPNDSEFIGRRINATTAVDIKSLILFGFLEPMAECLQHASNPLATCATPSRDLYLETEERRGEERERERASAPAFEPPPAQRELTDDERAEKEIRNQTGILERKLYASVARLSERTGRDTLGLMRQVTAYKAKDGTIVPGRSNPSGLTSERLEKSLGDAEAWLADLDKQGATA